MNPLNLSDRLAALDMQSHLHPYTNMPALAAAGGPLVIDCGAGAWVYDKDGQGYLEGVSGLWCTSLGFSEPRLVKAATAALQRLPFYHSFHNKVHDAIAELSHQLLARAPVPMDKIFFANSGSEAADTAVKLVWYYNNARGLPRKKKIIGRQRGYHGVTVASASLTGLAGNHQQFDLPLPGFLHVSCPHHYRHALDGETERDFSARLARELEQLIVTEGPDTVAAFFAEPLMGAGGVIPPPAGYFEAIQAVLDRHDVLLVIDEVITGFGRTGRFWGTQTYGIRPDILTCAKGMTSAYIPMSAVMLSREVAQAVMQQSARLGTFAHGFTYSGHPVAAAVALEVLKIYDERAIVERASRLGEQLQAGLRALSDSPLVGEARGAGMIGALEVVPDTKLRSLWKVPGRVGAKGAEFAQARGLILRAVADSLCVAPPLVISEEEVDLLLEKLRGTLQDLERWIAAEEVE